MKPPGYAEGSELEHFATFARDHLVQSIDDFDGKPLELYDDQRRLFNEALAYGPDGWPIWQSVVVIASRKNGKTTALAGYAVYRLVTAEGSPEILLAAASDRQAGRLFDAAASFIRRSPELSKLCRVREYVGEIVREDGRGRMLRMSSDPARLYGYNPSLVICDELAQWTTPTLIKAYAALTSAGGARSAPQTFTITTPGSSQERHSSILGRIVDAAEESDDLERKPGLLVSRMHDAKALAWVYEAPTNDPHDIEAMKLANPAPWITEEYLARQAANPELSDTEVLQLHGCVWAEADEQWISDGAWAACYEADAEIPEGESVHLGVDIGRKHDHTAIVALWTRYDGKTVAEAHVMATDGENNLDLASVEQRIRDLGRRWNLLGVVYDPWSFERSAQLLSAEGFPMIEHPMSNERMVKASSVLYEAINTQRIVHNGDPVFAAHVGAGYQKDTERGWRLAKNPKIKRPIDALIAMCIGYTVADQQPVGGGFEW